MASPFPELIGAACELVSFIIPYPRFSDLDRFGTSQRHSETQIGTIWNSIISMPEAAALSPSDLRSSSTVEVFQRTKKNWDVLGCNKQNMGRSLTKPRLATSGNSWPQIYQHLTVYIQFTCPLHVLYMDRVTSRPSPAGHPAWRSKGMGLRQVTEVSSATRNRPLASDMAVVVPWRHGPGPSGDGSKMGWLPP